MHRKEEGVAHEGAPREAACALEPIRRSPNIHAHDVGHREHHDSRQRRCIQHHPHLQALALLYYYTPVQATVRLGALQQCSLYLHTCSMLIAKHSIIPLYSTPVSPPLTSIIYCAPEAFRRILYMALRWSMISTTMQCSGDFRMLWTKTKASGTHACNRYIYIYIYAWCCERCWPSRSFQWWISQALTRMTLFL